MKYIIICLLLSVSTSIGSLSAQTLDNFKSKAAKADSTFSSRIKITEHGTASSAVHSMAAPTNNKVIRGYRVSIYIGNSQNSRAVSQSEMERFKELFPDIPVYRTYKNPDFKVTVGNCLSSDEAIIIWGRVKSSFDRASVIREDIPLSFFAQDNQINAENPSKSEDTSSK